MLAVGVLATACLAGLATRAPAQTLRSEFFITNGQVNAQVLRGNTLYVGGSFSFVGPVTGAGVPVDVTSGLPAPGYPRVNGTVMAAVADGSGGWFIGGSFTTVGASARANIAHVLSDQSVAAWNPGANGTVRALLLVNGVLYVGGDFATLAGTARNRAGALDPGTGTLASWNPNANNSVRALTTNGSAIWAGGLFTSIGGQARNRIAELNLTTGAADATWNANSNSNVFALAYDGSANVVYAGGQFTAIGGGVRGRIAALDPTTGSATSWNPTANNQVFAIFVNGSDVYVGGQFTNIGGQARNRIATLSASTGLASAWNPNAANTVQALVYSGSTVYAGGDFLTIGGQTRSRIAALDATTGLATPWNPSAFGTVSVLATSGSQVFVGGTFNGMGGTARNNLAAFDVVTGEPTAWDANANNQVQAVALTANALLVGGNFTQVGGAIRNSIAALDLTNGQATAWDPNGDGQVSALAVAGSRVYVGGLFATIGGQAHQNLAALDAGTGLALPWSADADDQVLAIDAGAATVYVGGNFLSLAGVGRDFLGAVSAATGAATSWDPAANGTVRAVAVTCDRAYVGGFFSSIGGQARNRLAAIDLASGAALAWDPNVNGPVFALLRQPGVVYAGGVFNGVGASTRNRIAAIDPQTGLASAWDPNSNGTVRAIAADAAGLYVGGSFSMMSAQPSGNLAVVTPDASTSCPSISLTSPPLPAGVVGSAYTTSITASGGASPYCYAVTAGSLPAGLALNAGNGQISGTPSAAGLFAFSVTATDVRGCTGTAGYTLSVSSAPAVNSVAANGAGLCLSPVTTCVSVPFDFTRGDGVGVRGVSVTFQLEAAKLKLCGPGPPASNVHLGTWGNSFANRSLQMTDLGSGRYTVDVVLLGAPCGATQGGSLFTLDVAAQGPTGTGSITVQSVAARDCTNGLVATSAGPATTVNISNAAIVLSPSTLAGGSTGSAYSEQLSAAGASGPVTFAVTSGTLPNGLTLSAAGLLSGTVLQAGTFSFTATATEADGCSGSRAYSFTFSCPTIAVAPFYLPDGAVGTAYSATLSAPAGAPPVAFAVTAGTLPAGLTLDPSGTLSGTPTTAGPASFTIGATDAAGCSGSRAYQVDIFASPPVSSVAANTTGLAISSAHPCVSVPFEYTRGETTPARGLTVSFQLDATKLALCSTPAASIHLGAWFNSFTNTQLQVTDDGGGAYTVDATLVGTPCGITTGGALFSVDLKSVGADGSGAITVTRVKSHDCDGNAIAVMAGPAASLRIQNTDITLAPPVLPNGFVGTPYSQAISAQSGLAPWAFSVTAGALPPGLSLASGGTLSGTPAATGTYSFTVSVSDAGGVPGSRAYSMSVSCPVISLSPSTLPDGQVGTPYAQTITASGGTGPYSFTIQSGELPAGLTLSSAGELAGTPTGTGSAVITVAAVDDFDCVGTEVYTLAVFTDPTVSHVTPSTAGLCLSSAHACVSVPFTLTRGESAPASAAHVRFQLDPSKLALCTPGNPAASIHAGTWLASFSNKTFQVIDHGGGAYSVDQALLGNPCGPTTGGLLFTVDVAAAGPDGVGSITVTEVRIRDCSNQPLPGQPGPAAALVVNHAGPPAIADLATTQVLTGNPPGERTGIVVTFTPPASGIVKLYRAPFGSYPEFDDGGGTAPDSAAAPGAPWTLVSASAASGLLDAPPTRGFWHYVAFVTDSCGNVSAVSNRSAGSLDYHLGDVTNGVTRGTGDNRVSTEDVSLLGAHYGLTGAAIVTAGVAYLDVGPTVNGLNTGRPATDDALDFNDLMVFSTNFHVVSAPQTLGSPAPPDAPGGAEAFELEAPTFVEAGDEFDAVLHLSASGAMQGFSARIGWDHSVVAPVSVTGGGLVEGQGGVVLSPGSGVADAALLGVRGRGIVGSGEAARFRFRVLREGDAALKLTSVLARDGANRSLDPAKLSRAVVAALPAHTLMLAPSPNPAPGATTLAIALAERGGAELAIYSVDGRRVRTLAHGTREAGAYRFPWRGEDDAGRAQSPGVYWARLTAGGRTFTRRIVFLR